jgi:hypothetical protein
LCKATVPRTLQNKRINWNIQEREKMEDVCVVREKNTWMERVKEWREYTDGRRLMDYTSI